MPGKRDGPTLMQITLQVLAELNAPTSVDAVVQAVLARYPFESKEPRKRVRNLLRADGIFGVELVYLNPQTIAPLRWAMTGIRFRVPLGPEDVSTGTIAIYPGFVPFLVNQFNYAIAQPGIELYDAGRRIGPTRLVTIGRKSGGPLHDEAPRDQVALDLGDWLRAQHAHAQDSLRVTITNWRPAHLRLEFEPYSDHRLDTFAAQNRALGDCVQALLDESYDEHIRTNPAILTAYARMPTARDYPGDHWLTVLANDPRFFITDWEIKRGEGISTVDFLRAPQSESDLRSRRFTVEQGSQVYRFTAAQNYGTQKCIVEIQGQHTLGDFDTVLREAFQFDPMDHLSAFTRITSRGKGKLPRVQRYGVIDPFEPAAAREVPLAGLDLQVGTRLEYLYDFGDQWEHTLVLVRIAMAERGVKYPRVVE